LKNLDNEEDDQDNLNQNKDLKEKDQNIKSANDNKINDITPMHQDNHMFAKEGKYSIF
jgi:hypothetical protein